MLIALSKIFLFIKKISILITLIAYLLTNNHILLTQNSKSNIKDKFEIEIKPDTIFTKFKQKTKTLNQKKEVAYTSELEKILKEYKLVDVNTIDSTIKINIVYSTKNNFLNRVIYKNLHKAYLQKEVAIKLNKAQLLLKNQNYNLSLVVLDAARPLSIQKQMWDEAPLSENEKYKFLTKPIYGSLHNYGAAVDVTICDNNNNYLNMGTPYDSFDELSYPAYETIMLKNGRLSQDELNNRLLLRKVMSLAGFSGIETEWWHFNSCSRAFAKNNYTIIESDKYIENTKLLAENKSELVESSANNISFKIQVMTSKRILKSNNALFKGLKIERYYHKELYKYTYGKYSKLTDAYKGLSKMKDIGYQDAFIVAFDKDTRITIKDASELIN